MKKQITFFLSLMVATMLSANNINVTNVKLTGQNTTGQYTMVQFDISWENSWRTSSVPDNWDAAWVFVKFRVSGGAWNHAMLNLTGHTAPSGSTITPSSDGTGAFIYRDAIGTGPFSETGVQLRWNYGANGVADNAVVDIQVFGIEMVYVPTGTFTVGSGGTEAGAFYKYPATTDPYQITGEGEITIGTITGNLYYGPGSPLSIGDHAGPIPAAFPKGYAAFYCMKYEMSQQDYVDFLNTLTYTQQVTRTAISPDLPAGTYLYDAYRNKIKISTPGIATTTPAIYATDYPYVACNDLSWADVAAYLDWSGLRPMTELEYEKACRGTGSAVANEYTWGTTGIASDVYTLSNPGAASEAIANNYSTSVGNAAYTLTTPLNGSINGPVRVGIFAANVGNNGRVTAGATSYGIMEMGGNLRERPVSIGNLTGRAFTGTHGNGTLDATGNADVLSWPGTNALGAGFRGGSWSNPGAYLCVSDRISAANTSDIRSISYGGRGVRLAPQSYFIGQSYGGGIIFYLDGTGQHGLIAAATDWVTWVVWGCHGTSIPGTSTAIGTGQANTTLIINGCSTAGIAARLCDDLVLNGYSDWFLPSRDELNQIYLQKALIGGFVDYIYWSSSEYDATSAWAQLWDTGAQGNYAKMSQISVRAVRTF